MVVVEVALVEVIELLRCIMFVQSSLSFRFSCFAQKRVL